MDNKCVEIFVKKAIKELNNANESDAKKVLEVLLALIESDIIK